MCGAGPLRVVLIRRVEGFATGPTPIIKAMDVFTSAANLQPNGMSQAIAYRLLRHCKYPAHLDRGGRRIPALTVPRNPRGHQGIPRTFPACRAVLRGQEEPV